MLIVRRLILNAFLYFSINDFSIYIDSGICLYTNLEHRGPRNHTDLHRENKQLEVTVGYSFAQSGKQ